MSRTLCALRSLLNTFSLKLYKTITLQPARKAILIGAPGKGRDRLPGVNNDLLNMKDHLLSLRGGRWHEFEIEFLWDPCKADVHTALQNTVVDYCYVYFAGHGFMYSGFTENFICLHDGYISDRELINFSPRQLIITDACRKYYHAISGIPEEYEEYDYFDGYSEARDLFDQAILNSPAGITFIRACSAGQVATEENKRSAGTFSLALLDGLHEKESTKITQYYSIDTAFDNAKKILKEKRATQTPVIEKYDGDLQVPFGILSPLFLREKSKSPNGQLMQRYRFPVDDNDNEPTEPNWVRIVVLSVVAALLWNAGGR